MDDGVCPGTCNSGYRRAWQAYDAACDQWVAAEEAHAAWRRANSTDPVTAGEEPERSERPEEPAVKPWWGEPIFCQRCAAQIRSALASLDDLASLRLLLADGYQTPGDALGERVRSTKTAPTASPGYDDLEELIGWLRDWETAYRDSQGWHHPPYRGRDAPALTSAVAWMLARLDRVLAHPDIGPEFGREVLGWHHRLQQATKTRPPMTHKPLPCPRCKRRSLFAHDDETVRCSNIDCNRVMSKREYEEYEDEADRQVSA